jgi:uncharacterized membrane protein YkgB
VIDPQPLRSRIAARSAELSAPAARLALCVVYAWFGMLKVLGLSPATDLVRALQAETLPFLDFSAFFVLFGAFEVLVGVLFLVPRLTSLALVLLAGHIACTLLPLAVLPAISWQGALVPTLEGQYIIKNVLIVAAAVTVAGSRSRPVESRVMAATTRAMASDALPCAAGDAGLTQ